MAPAHLALHLQLRRDTLRLATIVAVVVVVVAIAHTAAPCEAESIRVRVEILGSQKCRIVGKSQSALSYDRSNYLHPHP
jgi:hypothetical protein